MQKIGILALQGNVIEHKRALASAIEELELEDKVEIIDVRDVEDLDELNGIILPGGESTTISLLLEKYGMLEKLRDVPAIMGTCAGLILMAKEVEGLEAGQKTLGVMDVKVLRNAYGRQIDSFCAEIEWNRDNLLDGKKGIDEKLRNDDKFIREILEMGNVMFIRAPKIISVGESVKVLGKLKDSDEIVIVEQEKNEQYLLGMTCHPEMTSSKMAEYFLKRIIKK